MSKALKAALLSALVFPGLGHFSLKKPFQGLLLSSASLFCLYFLISEIIDVTNKLTIQLQNGEIAFDMIALSEQISSQLTANSGGLINIASLILLILWLIAIADSFRLGRLQDQKNSEL